MSEIVIRIDWSGFRTWLTRASEMMQANARQALGQGVALALAHAKATTKFKDRTGDLRRSITRGQKSTWHHFIKAGGPAAPHAHFVEYGTKPHRIEARRRKALRFVQSGEIRFRKHVWHPGTKATHFMDEAATEGARFLDWRMEDAIARAFR